IDNNKKGLDKVKLYTDIAPNITPDEIAAFDKGIRVPKAVFKIFREEFIENYPAHQEAIMKQIEGTIKNNKDLTEYAPLIIGSIKDITQKLYHDLENNKDVNLLVTPAPDKAKTVTKSNGKKENVIYKDGYSVTLRVNLNNDTTIYVQYTFYTDEERATDKPKSSKKKG
ncbi:hypothetical protein VF13_41615, partial [Nostoc linckia z16]